MRDDLRGQVSRLLDALETMANDAGRKGLTMHPSRHEQAVDRVMEMIEHHEMSTRSTPEEFNDLDHVSDVRGQWWVYSAPADVWAMREEPGRHAPIAPYSARSYQRLIDEFGPLIIQKKD